jgi:hypothetical protein
MDVNATTKKCAADKRAKPASLPARRDEQFEQSEQFEQFAKFVRQRGEPADAETLFNAAVRALARKG